MSRANWFAALLLTLGLGAPAFSGAGRTAAAQEAQQPQPSSTAPAKVQKDHRPLSEAEKKEHLLEKEEEGEVDPNEVFKHSSAVRWISRKTGLSIDGAFWLCMVLNFVVVFVGVWMFLKKIGVPAVYRNRAEAVRQRLEEARKTSEEARQRLSEVEARLSRLDREIEQMRTEAEASARGEEERTKAEVENERRRIVDSAEQEIVRLANAARRELKAYAAELGVSLAEKKIRIEEHADERLVRDFASHLGRDGH